MSKTKICKSCGKEKDVKKFPIYKLEKGSICLKCLSEQLKKHNQRYGEMPWYTMDIMSKPI